MPRGGLLAHQQVYIRTHDTAVFLKHRALPTQTSALIIVKVCPRKRMQQIVREQLIVVKVCSRKRMQQIVGEQTKVRSAACIDVATEANERAGIVITQVCSRESMPKHTHTKENIAANVVARGSPDVAWTPTTSNLMFFNFFGWLQVRFASHKITTQERPEGRGWRRGEERKKRNSNIMA